MNALVIVITNGYTILDFVKDYTYINDDFSIAVQKYTDFWKERTAGTSTVITTIIYDVGYDASLIDENEYIDSTIECIPDDWEQIQQF